MAISIIRTIIIYLAIVVSMRVMGKRQLGELEPAELVVAVLISDLAAHPLQDIGTPLLYGLLPIVVLVFCEILMSGAIIKSQRFGALVCGKPSIIIENGRINETEMRKNRVTLDELAEQLRKKDILDISTVKYAVLETGGSLSAILYPGDCPVTPNQMNIQTDDTGYPIIVINDGCVLEDNLRKLGFNRAWLDKQLQGNKLKNPKDVYLMSADMSGRVYLSKRRAV